MKILSSKAEITFDDVLLLPNKSDFPIDEEGKEINLSTKVSKNIELDIPILSSPMPGVTEEEMAITLGKAGGMGFIHCSQNFNKQLEQVSKVKRAKVKVAASVGDLSTAGFKHIEKLIKVGADLISVESYHAHNNQVINFIKKLKKTYRKIEISVSLVVTPDATKDLIKAGADSIRVGIGGGSHCTTRLVTGIGRPQLSAIKSCSKITRKYKIPLISDTGIKYVGDVAKALIFGADCVMIGGMFAGTDEAPGEIVRKRGKKYKYSWGMCTDTALKQKSPNTARLNTIKQALNYSLRSLLRKSSGHEMKFFEEGVEGLIVYKGSVEPVLTELISGIKRSLWYQGARNIKELRRKARVVLVSQQTITENVPRI